jgi:hypothetical protein
MFTKLIAAAAPALHQTYTFPMHQENKIPTTEARPDLKSHHTPRSTSCTSRGAASLLPPVPSYCRAASPLFKGTRGGHVTCKHATTLGTAVNRSLAKAAPKQANNHRRLGHNKPPQPSVAIVKSLNTSAMAAAIFIRGHKKQCSKVRLCDSAVCPSTLRRPSVHTLVSRGLNLAARGLEPSS